MALDPENLPEFAGKINPADANYTRGSAVDVSSPGAGDGTPFIEELVNDTFGWQQALLDEVGAVPTGAPDTAIASQYLDAFKELIAIQSANDTPVIIDGGFNIWPEFLTNVFTSDGYSANNFFVSPGTLGGGTATVSRQNFILGQTDVPGNPKHFMNFDQTISPGSGQSEIAHRVEFVETFSDTTTTFKFWAKASANLNVDVAFRQNFGTSGAPSAAVETSGGSIAVTTLWQKFTIEIPVPSVSGKTLGTDLNDYFSLVLTIDNTEGIFSLDTTSWSTGKGEFVIADMQTIIKKCERYYEKSYQLDTPTGTITPINRALFNAPSTDTLQYSYFLKSTKRSIPVITFFSPGTGNVGFMDESNPVILDVAVTATTPGLGNNKFELVSASFSTNKRYQFHFTADARL